MSVKVVREPRDLRGPYESCCFCRAYTPFWHASDVACCEQCAALADEADLPSKKKWIRRERIATRRL